MRTKEMSVEMKEATIKLKNQNKPEEVDLKSTQIV